MNHYIFDIRTNKIVLKDIEKLFNEIVDLLKLTVLKKEKYVFDNGWFTLFWLLAESHISAHYRIENNYLALDIYSCRNLDYFERDISKLIWKLGEFKLTKLQRYF